jgi:hypothetical protein
MQIEYCGWPLVKYLATIWLLPHVCFIFNVILYFDCVLLIVSYQVYK